MFRKAFLLLLSMAVSAGIVYGATFGKATYTGETNYSAESSIWGSRYNLTESGTVSGISVWCAATGGSTATLQVGIYSNNATSNTPQDLMVHANITIPGYGNGVYNVTGLSTELPAGSYWLLFTGSAYVYYNTDAAPCKYQTFTAWNNPASGTWSDYSPRDYAIFATYNATGGSGTGDSLTEGLGEGMEW